VRFSRNKAQPTAAIGTSIADAPQRDLARRSKKGRAIRENRTAPLSASRHDRRMKDRG
jgi:hypothetical protein